MTPLAHLVIFIVSAILQWRGQLLFTGIVGGAFTLAVLPYAAFHLDDYFGPCREPWDGLGVAPKVPAGWTTGFSPALSPQHDGEDMLFSPC